ncbi:sulfite reductase subunit beta [Lactarius deliciosus]|nr:sulfite reductase subunit beta [Lactarius deliciosus]
MLTPSITAVARVAHLSSDAVVDSPSVFSSYWKSLSRESTNVTILPHGSDPTQTLLRLGTTSLSSYTTTSSPSLIRLLPHVSELSSRPIVFHIAAQGDLADALVLREVVPYFIHSSSAQQAHDNALLASRLARTERKAVVHVFHIGGNDDKIEEVAEDKVKPFIFAEKHPRTPSKAAGRPQSPIARPHSPSPARPYSPSPVRPYSPSPTRPYSPVPRYANGHSNGHTNGFVNGHSRKGSDTDGRHSSRPATPTTPPIFAIPVNPATTALLEGYEAAALATLALTRRSQLALAQHGSNEPHTVIFGLGQTNLDFNIDGVAYVDVSLLSPLPSPRILGAIRPSARHVIVLEQIEKWTTKWTPAFPRHRQCSATPRLLKIAPLFAVPILGDTSGLQSEDVATFLESTTTSRPSTRTPLGGLFSSLSTEVPHVPKHESSYTSILSHLFGERLEIPNSPSLVPSQGEFATSPEFALGRVRGALEERNELVNAVLELLQDPKLPQETHSLLSRWVLIKDDAAKSQQIGDQVVAALQDYVSHPAATRILSLREHFRVKSRWIIGSDAWSYDLGASGIHHTIVSGLNLNTLILDTLPYTARNSSAHSRRKTDIGLYAMNYGGVFVASVAVYSSYAQVLQALVEADKFDGPSVVLAYLPYTTEDSTALDLLKETKLAVDSGYWPLYRWDPSKEAGWQRAILSGLGRHKERPTGISRSSEPPFSVVSGRRSRRNVRGARNKPTLICYLASMRRLCWSSIRRMVALAEKKAKRLAGRAQARGLSTTIATLDTMDLDAVSHEEHVLFVTSTAGPRRASAEWPKILQTAQRRDCDRSEAVGEVEIFGPGRSLTRNCRRSAASGLPELGLGDDQDCRWCRDRLQSVGTLGVESVGRRHILRGTIADGLEDTSTGALAASDTQLTKFHGIYQQDDRDIRDEREAQGVEPAYAFMIRVRLPAGACGDVNRNVLCSSIPSLSNLHAQVYAFAKGVSEHLLPRTTAYHEIWLDKKLVAGEALKDFEPLYGEFYLPRKFKIAVAVPPTNDVDVFANDVGYIAIVDERGELAGFNVTAGGGMGVTHGSKKTYPRTGSIFGFVTPEQGQIVAEKIMLVQKENGNRADRKNARLKYTIDRMGLDVFKAEVEKLLGFRFQPARPFTFDRNIDDFGWQTGEDGKHHFTCFIENGRVQDEPGRDFKTALREIAKVHKGEFRLTANQHLIISNIATPDLPEIKRLLAHYKLDNLDFTALRLSSSACVAFPTCGLAMAESERYLPLLIDKVEKICEENGLRNDSIVMRMTGCPNGCARPYIAEVAFVGKAPGAYMMLLGGGYYGQRLNKIYRESVTEPEILAILKPMIKHYALERLDGERFGDFVIRAGYISPVTEGKAWYEGMGGEGPYREIVA